MGQWAEDCLEAELQGKSYEDYMQDLADEELSNKPKEGRNEFGI